MDVNILQMEHIRIEQWLGVKEIVPYKNNFLLDYTGTIYSTKDDLSLWFLEGFVYKKFFWDQDWTTTRECYYYDHSHNYVKTFEEMFESLPKNLQEIIIWNLDIWKLEDVKDLEVK